MDIKTVAVRLVSYHDDFKKGMKESGDSTATFSKVTTGALLAAGTAAAAFAVKAADGYVAYGRTIMGLARISGDGVETMSKLNYAAQQSNVSSEALANGMKFLEKNMASGNAEFDKLGVSTRTANGAFRSTHDVLLDTADAISHLKAGTEQTDAILKVFGRSGLELGPLLAKGRAGILALEEEAKKYGLVLTADQLPAIQANIKAHKQLDAAMQGASNQIGASVLPELTSLTEAFANLPGPVASLIVPIGGIAGGLGALAVVGPKAASAFSLVTKNMNGTEMAISGGLLAAIAAVTAEITAANAASHAFSVDTFKNVDFAKPTTEVNEFGKSIDTLRAEGKRLSELDIWGKIANVNQAHALRDAVAQADENAQHIRSNLETIQSVATGLGTSGAEVTKMLDTVHIDATTVTTSKLVEVLGRLKSGEIDAAEATKELGGSTDDVAASIDNMKKATKDLNDAETALFNPQFALVDSMSKLQDAQDKAAASQWAVVAANVAYKNAVAIWGPNSDQAREALWKLNDAQSTATKSSNDLAKANMDVDAATRNLQVSVATGESTWDQTRATLDGWTASGRMTAAQSDRVAAALLRTKIQAEGLDGTSATVTVLSNFVTSGLDQFKAAGLGAFALAGIRPNASGTAGMADGWNSVGEEGPELLHKQGSSVAVISGPQTRRMLTSGRTGGVSAATGDGAATNNYAISFPNYVGDKRELMDVVLAGLRDHERSRDGRR